jgi:hypothetical protein
MLTTLSNASGSVTRNTQQNPHTIAGQLRCPGGHTPFDLDGAKVSDPGSGDIVYQSRLHAPGVRRFHREYEYCPNTPMTRSASFPLNQKTKDLMKFK